jgi:flagellar protein FliS
MNTNAAINKYTQVGLESAVIGADPHRLILMLFEGALQTISNARIMIQKDDFVRKGKSIAHAIRIIGEGLNASLDKKIGGKLAQDLSSLYDYMVRRLVDANINNDINALDEVTRLLTELKEAWEAIKPDAPASVQKVTPSAQLVYTAG